jgi:phosphopantothenoylcysteine decarboxylase / phosphopantothenate---cysteine ligase
VHPSRVIRGRRSRLLTGRRIVVGISGSIAAIEAPRIIRELIRHGAEITAVMSPEATRIVTAEAIAFATGSSPVLQLTGDVEHVTLLGPGEGRADLLLIAPATANTISKIANGIDDTAVTSCASVALGGGVPILIAPAMHSHMAQNPAIRENLDRLISWGVGIIAPQSTEGEEKIATPEEIAAAVAHRLSAGPWTGRRVIVVGGASREPIDAVRSVTNESSGATAVALASQAHHRGATVELWAGAMQVPVPGYITVERWSSVGDLVRLIREHRASLRSADVVMVPAALSDFTLSPKPGKISSRGQESLSLTLNRAPKVLPLLRESARSPTYIVGFKLEADLDDTALSNAARELLKEATLDAVIGNDRASLGAAVSRVVVVRRHGDPTWLAGAKWDLAGEILDVLGAELPERGKVRRGRSEERPHRSSPRGRGGRRRTPTTAARVGVVAADHPS